MNIITEAARAVLRDDPRPALRSSELLPLVAARVDRALTLPRLEGSLAEHPECFRILDPWRGLREPLEDMLPREPIRQDLTAWVVLIEAGVSRPGPGDEVLRSLREGIRWVARAIDPRSPLEVAQWCTLVEDGREALAAFDRPVAGG